MDPGAPPPPDTAKFSVSRRSSDKLGACNGIGLKFGLSCKRKIRQRDYEAYILQEVIPFMLSENGVSSLAVHGCSIGDGIQAVDRNGGAVRRKRGRLHNVGLTAW